jgi:hypothetical protein
MHEGDYHCRTSRKYSLSETDVQQWNKDKKSQLLVLPDYKAPHYITFSVLVLLPLS